MKPPREPHPDDFESDPLWDLLGKAEQPRQASPFFARNVVREVRLAQARRSPSPFLGLLRNWRLLVSSMAVAVLITSFGKMALDDSFVSPSIAQARFAGDLEVIKNLDEHLELLDLENSVWLETTASAY